MNKLSSTTFLLILLSFGHCNYADSAIIGIVFADPVPDEDAVYVTISAEVPDNPSGALATDFHIEATGDMGNPLSFLSEDYGTLETLAFERSNTDISAVTLTTSENAFGIEDGLDGPGVICFFFDEALAPGQMFEVTIPVTFDYFDDSSHNNAQHVQDAVGSFGDFTFSFADLSFIGGPRQALDFEANEPGFFSNHSVQKHHFLDVVDNQFEFKARVISEPAGLLLMIPLVVVMLLRISQKG